MKGADAIIQCLGVGGMGDGKPNDLDLYDSRYGIEDTRALVRSASMSPSVGRWHVIVVEDADRLTEQGIDVVRLGYADIIGTVAVRSVSLAPAL